MSRLSFRGKKSRRRKVVAAKRLTLFVVVTIIAYVAGGSVRGPTNERFRILPADAAPPPEWHDGFNHFIVRLVTQTPQAKAGSPPMSATAAGTAASSSAPSSASSTMPGPASSKAASSSVPSKSKARLTVALDPVAVEAMLARIPGVKRVQVAGQGYYAVTTTLSGKALRRASGATSVSPELLGRLESASTTTEPAPPNDPYFQEAYYLANWGQGGIGSLNGSNQGSRSTPGASADAAQAWPYSLGSGVTIADVDTGVASNIPELAGQVSPLSENFTTYPLSSDVSPIGKATDYDHGTLVADVLAAKAGNGVGAAGIAPGAKVMNLKCTDGSTVSDLCVYEAGWYAIHHGAKIINLSLAFLGNDTLLDELAADAENAGVLVVAAAGNFSKDNDSYTVSPANLASKYPNVISVGASDMNDAKASFSDYGPSTVDLMAPGSYILGQEPDGSFVFANGTSFATPMVSATAALMLSEDPSLSPEQIKTDILDTVDHPRSLAGLTVTGGRLDAAAAVASVQGPVSFTFTGMNDIIPSKPSQFSVTAKVASPVVEDASALTLKTDLAYAYRGRMYGVVGQRLGWEGQGQIGETVTGPEGQALLGFGSVPRAFTGPGLTTKLSASLPSGSYALVASLVAAPTGAMVGHPEAVFFNVGPPSSASPSLAAPPSFAGTSPEGGVPATGVPATGAASSADAPTTPAPPTPASATLPLVPTRTGLTTTTAGREPVEPTIPMGAFKITQISPDVIAPRVTADVSVFGDRLPENAAVKIGGSWEPVTFDSSQEVDVSIMGLPSGLYPLSVLNAAGTISVTLPDALQVTGSGETVRTDMTAGGAGTTSPRPVPTSLPSGQTPTTRSAIATTSPVAPPLVGSFKISDGLSLGTIPTSEGAAGVPVGTWPTVSCEESSCPGVSLSS